MSQGELTEKKPLSESLKALPQCASQTTHYILCNALLLTKTHMGRRLAARPPHLMTHGNYYLVVLVTVILTEQLTGKRLFALLSVYVDVNTAVILTIACLIRKSSDNVCDCSALQSQSSTW
jgi:hypothetical protein